MIDVWWGSGWVGKCRGEGGETDTVKHSSLECGAEVLAFIPSQPFGSWLLACLLGAAGGVCGWWRWGKGGKGARLELPQESIQSSCAAHVLTLGTGVQATSVAAQLLASSWMLVRVQFVALKRVITIEVILYKYSRQCMHAGIEQLAGMPKQPIVYPVCPTPAASTTTQC